MPATIRKPARAARTAVVSPAASDPDRSDERAIRGNQAGNQSGRRRFVDPTTCERDYSEAEKEFMLAMDEYKRQSGRTFPTWSEVLEVLRGLGYEKAAEDRSVDDAPTAIVQEAGL